MKIIISTATGFALVLPFITSAGMMSGTDGGYGLMSHGGVLMFITWLVWLTVGILAVIWLWKQINKKD